MVLKVTLVSIIYVLFIFNSTLLIGNIDKSLLAINFLIIFFVNSILYLNKYRKHNIICVETFFSIAFLLSTFQYPFIVSEMDQYTINKFFILTNESYAHGMCIAMLGYLFYLLGAIIVPKTKKINKHSYDYSSINIVKLNVFFQYLCFALFSLIMILGGYRLLSQYSDGNDDRWAGVGILWSFLFIFFNISSIFEFIRLGKLEAKGLKTFMKKANKIYIFNAVSIISFFLLAGYRSEALSLIFPLLFLYSMFIRKIKKKTLLFVIVLGFFMLVIIGGVRGESGGLLNINNVASTRSELNNISFLFRDFTSANGGLFYLVNFADKNGITWGSNILLQVVSVIPFMQSFIILVFGFKPGMSSSDIFTIGLNGMDYTSGLGTNIFGDLYYTFGLGGVIIVMFSFGWFISYLYNKIALEKRINIYMLIAMCYVFGNSLYCIRVEFFYIFRNIGLSILLFWIAKKMISFKKN